MTGFFDAAAARYSHRDVYTGREVPEEHLLKIARAAIQAPSGNNRQTTRIIIVRDRARVRAVAGILGKTWVETAGAVLVFTADPSERYHLEDCAAAVENALLAVTALGYASCWIDGALRRQGRAGKLGELLGVPASLRVQVVLPVGVPAVRGKPAEKKPLEARVFFERFPSA